MVNIAKLFVLILATSLLAGCINQEDFATEPVRVNTANGQVVCQLYRLDNLTWDEAISVPRGMTIEAGDAIRKNKGFEILEENRKNNNFLSFFSSPSEG